MEQRNANNKAQAVKINITIPLSERQEKNPVKTNCSNCASCGTCGQHKQHTGTPLLNHAAEALLNMAAGAYTLEQLESALEIIEALLKRHYSRQP
jgi:hypothetical protein